MPRSMCTGKYSLTLFLGTFHKKTDDMKERRNDISEAPVFSKHKIKSFSCIITFNHSYNSYVAGIINFVLQVRKQIQRWSNLCKVTPCVSLDNPRNRIKYARILLETWGGNLQIAMQVWPWVKEREKKRGGQKCPGMSSLRKVKAIRES